MPSLMESSFKFPTSIPTSSRRTRTRTTGSLSIGKGQPSLKSTGAASKPAKSDRESEPGRIISSSKPSVRTGTAQRTMPKSSKAPRSRVHSETSYSETHAPPRTLGPHASISTSSLNGADSPSPLHTMKTRVAVRDRTPHRFQIVPLREVGPGTVEVKGGPVAIKKETSVEPSPPTKQVHIPLPVAQDPNVAPFKALNVVKLPAKWTAGPSHSRKTSSLPFTSETATYFAASARQGPPIQQRQRTRTLSERDINIPSPLKPMNKHTRSSTAKQIPPLEFTSNEAIPSRRPSVVPQTTPAINTIPPTPVRSSPHFKSTSLGGELAFNARSTPRATISQARKDPNVENAAPATTQSPSEAQLSSAATKKRNRHVTTYSLDILNSSNSNLARFASSRTSCAPTSGHSRIPIDVRKVLAASPDEIVDIVTDARRQSMLKRQAIYSRSIFVPSSTTPNVLSSPRSQSAKPPIPPAIPALNSRSFDSLICSYQNRSIDTSHSSPQRSKTIISRPVTPLTVRKQRLQLKVEPSGGTQHHPIIQELILSIERAICEWNGVKTPF